MSSRTVAATVAGVMICSARTSPSFKKLRMAFVSLALNTPSSTPASTMACTSSRLTESWAFSLPTMRVTSSESNTKG